MQQIISLPVLPSLDYFSPVLSPSSLAMGHMRDGAILLDVDVEPLGDKISGHHHARLDDARLLRELRHAESLRKTI